MTSYRELRAWQLARALVREVYSVTASFPREEQFGLTSQMRRSAVAIAANIAEGYGRRTRGEYVQCLGIANGEVFELETFIILSSDLGYCKEEALLPPCEHCGRVLRKLIESLKPV